MPVIFAMADSFLQNDFERLVHSLYLSIFLVVVRERMTILKPQLGCYLFHYFILKLTAMINDNLTWDAELGNNLIEYEECDIIHVGFNCRNGFDPRSKVFYGHDNVMIPPS